MITKKRIIELYEKSSFAKENLSLDETLLLLCEKIGISREDAIIKSEFPDSILPLVERAFSGEPLGYILGYIPFFESDFYVGEGVLIPRCDSEILVLTAIDSIPQNATFLDLCSGSGCIGISILKRRPDTRCIFVDISGTALSYTEKNIISLGVEKRAKTVKLDILNDDINALGDFQAVVMNPPYITGEEMKKLPLNVQREPALALYGGEDGMDFYRKVHEKVKNKTVIFEIGSHQGERLISLYGNGKIIKDLSKNDRVFLLRS